MKITHIGKYYHPYRGGIETVVKNLAEGFVLAQDQVSIICANEEFDRSEEEIAGVKVLRLPQLAVVASQPLLLSVREEMKRALKNSDILHFHAPNPLVEFCYLTLKEKVPAVVTYHSDIVKQKKIEKLYRPFLKKFLKKVDAIVVASPQAIEYSPVLPEFKEKCHVVPFGVFDQNDKQQDATSQVEELRGKYGKYALFVGRLVGYKGLDVLLEAWKDISQNLVIVGTGPLEEELKRRARENSLEDRIHFLGKVQSDEELQNLFRGSETFILPSVSRAEAFGMVMIEAMSFSTPIISTLLDSGVSFVNKDQVSGFQVPVGDTGALEQAIKKIMGDSELRTRLAQGARQRYEEMFSINRMVEGYREIYRSVLGE